MSECPCGSGQPTDACCLPVIRGERSAQTPEELMRSRYSAFALGEVDWIIVSHHSDTRDEINRDNTEQWSKQSTWLGLTVHGTDGGGQGDDEGRVHFTAKYREPATGIVKHEEHALFKREDGEWRFHSVDLPELPELPPVTPKAPVGRNDPCPCGSGKKYKKCHGTIAVG